MKKAVKIAIPLICLAIIAVVIAIAAKKQGRPVDPQTPSQTRQEQPASEYPDAPDFTVTMNNGGTFTLSEHKDGVVLLNFWATWCPPCVGELPAFEKLKNDNIDSLEIIAVNCSEQKSTVDAFIAENGYTFDFAYDENGAAQSLYPTDGIPYTIVIGNGKILKTFLGAPRDPYNEYKKAIEECLAK